MAWARVTKLAGKAAAKKRSLKAAGRTGATKIKGYFGVGGRRVPKTLAGRSTAFGKRRKAQTRRRGVAGVIAGGALGGGAVAARRKRRKKRAS